MSILKNSIKSILFKTKYYSISYKLNFICNLNLFKQDVRIYKPNTMYTYYNKFILDRYIVRHQDNNNSIEKYYYMAKPHRDNKPAVIRYKGDKVMYEAYYQNGLRHRDNGPAIVYYRDDGTILIGEYYKFGYEVGY